MTRVELTRAADLLREASNGMDDDALVERTSGTAEQLARFADADRGPDHGRIARIENTLREIEADTEGDVRATVERAHGQLSAYRETVEGI